MTSKERRRAVRAPAKLAMEVKLSGKDCGNVETINVSANGVYFSSRTFVAPLTRLEIVLLLPGIGEGGAKDKRQVVCEGVVVRSEPVGEEEKPAQYEIACYFTSINEKDRSDLESYILSTLTF